MINFYYKNAKGFTTVELLVTVAVIALVVTIGIYSLRSSSAKARDSRRLNDVQSLVKTLSIAAAENTDYLLQYPCDTAGTLTKNCSGFQPGTVAQDFPKFFDPIGTVACTDTSDLPCDYTIRNDEATVDDAQIMFYLEKDAGSLEGGKVHWIDGGGLFDQNP